MEHKNKKMYEGVQNNTQLMGFAVSHLVDAMSFTDMKANDIVNERIAEAKCILSILEKRFPRVKQ